MIIRNFLQKKNDFYWTFKIIWFYFLICSYTMHKQIHRNILVTKINYK